jgi:TPR repeat protein
LAAFSPAAFASPSAAGGPVLPASAKHRIALGKSDDLLRKALDGDAASATEIGETYAYGANIPPGVPEAMRGLTRGVDLGSGEARRELGLLLLSGKGIQKDSEHAASLLRQAAEDGDSDAEAALGAMYAYGDGISQD